MSWENSSVPTTLIFTAIVVLGIFFILKWTKDKTKNVSTLRLFIQIVAVVAVFMGLILGPFGIPQWLPLGIAPRDRLIGGDFFGYQFPDGLSVPILACYYPSGRTVTCAIWQIQAYIYPMWNTKRGYEAFYSTSGLEKLGIVFGLIIVMSLVLGRVFCGWLCPFGLYMDLIARIRKVFGRRHLSFSKKMNKSLGQLRYVIIALFLILSVIFSSYAIFGTEFIPGTVPGGPQGNDVGIVGAINEPYCLVCPVRPLCVLVECALGYMSFSYVTRLTFNLHSPLYVVGFYLTSINLVALILVTILAFAYRRFWCRICPLGGLTALFSTFTPFKQIALTRLHKDEEKCTKCGVCKRVCPTQVTEVYDEKGGDVTVSGCMLCFRCVEMCPYEDALKVKIAGKTIFKSRDWLEPSKSD
jgi:ferredoxin